MQDFARDLEQVRCAILRRVWYSLGQKYIWLHNHIKMACLIFMCMCVCFCEFICMMRVQEPVEARVSVRPTWDSS